ncbi:MAG: STAS/SEC14 domain-containing protein [Gammaproteobacteria bacterium]|nr:STAS/SEC14 domain-containing protein [Gammaproteobacteria bacterium]MCP5137678.1 STAS/SEC14 domain-containing protein [Gammaproteobacteria bacterium]
MLEVTVDEAARVAVLEPEGALSERDFELAAAAIDPLIEKYGALAGIVIHAESFPGWASFAALISHLRFVRDHHQKVTRLALVTDSVIAGFAETLGGHFLKAEIRAFAYPDFDRARNWVAQAPR